MAPAADLVRRYWTAPAAARPDATRTAAEAVTVPAPPDAATLPALWTLEEVLARIRRANPDLATARARMAGADAARAHAVAAWYPTLVASQSWQRTDNPGTAFGFLLNQERLTLGPGFDPTPGSIDNWRTELRLDLELFAPGRGARVDAATAEARAAALSGEAIERRLLNAGIQAWLGLRAALALRAVSERTVAVVAERLEQTRARAREGAALNVDVLRLEVRLAEAKQDEQQSVLAVRQAESQIQSLMGLHGDARVELADEPLPSPAVEALGLGGAPAPMDALARAVAHAREHRLDLLAAAETVRGHDYRTRAARAGYLPRLVAFGAYDIDGDDLERDLDLDSYFAGVALEWRLSGRTGPRIREADAEARRARAELAALAGAVTREIADGLAALEVARRSHELAVAAAAAAEEAYRLVAAAQDAGGATVTDVLEAENARDDAAAREVVSRTAVAIAQARLAAAVGEVGR